MSRPGWMKPGLSMRVEFVVLLTSMSIALAACGRHEPAASPLTEPVAYGRVDMQRLALADRTPENWYTNGRDAQGSYFSPLSQINAENIDRLGYAWDYDLGTARGQEATPIVVDGIMFAVGNWGRVYALDAGTGRELWTFVPQVDGQYARYACCDVVQRGLVIWKGRVYAGATDGYLHALDAQTGKLIWRADTLPSEARAARMPYTSSGSPQIAGDVIVIGNGGADFGVRGFVSAFDLATGQLAWRFHTVPRDPKQGAQEAVHLERALATWDPEGAWTKTGGGGTAWDGMAYDAALDLLYVGTGNGAPYDYKERSPKGGDNLYIASILAIRPKTGELAWYFQQIPGERWDYTATQKFILADIELGGRKRSVIMQAPKNGFLYVLDRATGEFLSGKPFIPLNWTSGLDAAGRPIENPSADYTTGPKLISPGFAGGHNWQPMSRDPRTGIVYIPIYEEAVVMVDSRHRPIGSVPGQYTTYPIYPEAYESEEIKMNLGALPSLETLSHAGKVPLEAYTTLQAMDPISGRILWQARSQQVMASGVMSTAGDLVFYGRPDGTLLVYASASGALLKTIETGSSILAAPMSYAVNGKQYVAVITGYGGGAGFSFPPRSAAARRGNRNRIISFTLDGGATPVPKEIEDTPMPAPIAWSSTSEEVERGRKLFFKNCAVCHAFGPGLTADLRRMTPQTHALFEQIVLQGLYVGKGMGRFDDALSSADVHAIHGYLVQQTREAAGTMPEGARPTRAQ